jgi:hypothetical protein
LHHFQKHDICKAHIGTLLGVFYEYGIIASLVDDNNNSNTTTTSSNKQHPYMQWSLALCVVVGAVPFETIPVRFHQTDPFGVPRHVHDGGANREIHPSLR